MDQEKIGKFISKLRKDNKMTQEQLALKMGVSINAVSKWERGLCFPDISLLKKLCNELGISVEELINGEKDNSEEAKERAIISTIKDKNKIKKNSNIRISLIIIIFSIVIIGLIYYLKSTKINLINNSDNLYDLTIEYLRNEEFKNNPDSTKKDFNVFFSYHGFGIEEDNEYKYAYMWVFKQSYYIETKDSLAISSGSSMPLKVKFKNNKVVEVIYPKDGNMYTSSIKEIFPSLIATQILHFDNENNINKLFNDVLYKKNKYYGYLNLDMSKITIDDISYGDVIFSVKVGKRTCIPILLTIYKNNKYKLYTSYESCREDQVCNLMLKYTKYIEGNYDYDVMQIIKHSIDANNMQFTNDSLPEYEIYGGNNHMFITDNDNKYLFEFLSSIGVDLTKCAEPDYIN